MGVLNASNVSHALDAIAARIKAAESSNPMVNPIPVDAANSKKTIPPATNIDAIGANLEQDQTQQTDDLLSQPVLVSPSAQAVAQASGTSVYAVIAAMQEAIYNGSVDTMNARMNLNATLNASRVATIEEAIQATEAAKQKYQDALRDVHNTNGQLSDANEALRTANQNLTAAQNNLVLKQATADLRRAELAAEPGNPDVQAKYAAALSDLNDATATQLTALTAADNASQAQVLCAAAATLAAQTAVAAMDEVTRCLNDLTVLTDAGNVPVDPIVSPDEMKSAMRALMECMMKLSELLSTTNEDKLNNNLKLYRDMQNLLQKECAKKSEDFIKAVADAEKKQKTMKLVGKIVGWALTGLTVGAAIISGGTLAALVPVVAALSVAVADEVLDSQGKTTISGAAMEPIMGELMKGLTSLVKELKPDISDEDAQIVAMILAAVTLVVASTVAAKGAGKLGDMAGKMATKLPLGVRDALAKLSSMGFKGIGNPTNPARLQAGVKSAGAIAALSNTVIQVGMSISVATKMRDARNLEGDTAEDQAILELIKRVIQAVVDAYSSGARDAADVSDKALEFADQQSALLSATTRIMANTRAA